MPIDASIPLQAQVPNGMSTLGNVLGIANAAQELKQRRASTQLTETAAQSSGAVLNEQNNVRALFQHPEQFSDGQGNIDFNKLGPMVMQAAPTQGGTILASQIKANQDATAAKQALLTLNDTQRQSAGAFAASLGDDSPEVAKQKMDGVAQLNPQLKPALDFAWEHYLGPNAGNPGNFKIAAQQVGKMVLSVPGQIAAATPSGIPVTNQQQSSVVNTAPYAAPIGATIPGTAQQLQPPPTTQVYNPQTRAPELLGPQPPQPIPGSQIPPEVQANRDAIRKQMIQSEVAKVSAWPDSNPNKATALQALNTELGAMQPAMASKRIQTGPSLGEAEQASGVATTGIKDFDQTTQAATNASTDIGVLQRIKELAPGAIKGVASDRRAFMAGVAGLLGVNEEQLTKTKTDELVKNVNMLASQAGANTDAYRNLIEGSRPNTTMTQEAIINSANQVIAQRQLALIKQQHMTHFTTNPQSYAQELANFNSFADARAIQFPNMSPDEKRSMWQSMSPSERDAFGMKLSKLQSYGYIK